jgi:hypothetical protein
VTLLEQRHFIAGGEVIGLIHRFHCCEFVSAVSWHGWYW